MSPAPIQLTGTVVGAAEVQVRFRAAEERVRRRLREAVARQATRLQRKVKEDYLRGPRPEKLGRVTGNLSRSVNIATESRADYEGAAVGTNVIYGRIHELGFHGTMKVRAHTRKDGKVVAQGVKFSKPRLRKDGTLSTPATRRLKRQDVRGDVAVKAHERDVDYPGKPFLKPSLEELKPSIRTELIASLEGAF